jgi:hypothetical protein
VIDARAGEDERSPAITTLGALRDQLAQRAVVACTLDDDIHGTGRDAIVLKGK